MLPSTDSFFLGSFYMSVVLYLIVCLPIAYLLTFILLKRYGRYPKLMFLLIYGLCISMFVLGVIIAALLTWLLYYSYQGKKPISIKTVEYPDFQKSPVREYVTYGEGSVLKLLSNESINQSTRERLLFSANEYGGQEASKLNLLAIDQEMEGVLIYAQSIIEKKERALSDMLYKLNKMLKSTDNEQVAAYYKKQIAEVYWEQVYHYLISDEMLSSALKMIEDYAKEAFQNLTEDIELPFLLTRIELKRNNPSAARKWLQKATLNQAPEHKVVPLLAEIEFLERKYNKISYIFKHFETTGVFQLNPIVQYWKSHD